MKLPAGQTLFLPHSQAQQFVSEFQVFLPLEIQNSHVRRKQDWVTSRVALQKLFLSMGQAVTAEQLAKSGHQTIPAVIDFKFSLSHSETGALVWLVPKSEKLAIGVDIESMDRKMNPNLENRIRNQQDDKSLSLIGLWSLKEAIYKSLPKTMQPGLAFSQIYSQAGDFFIPLLSVKGHWLQKIEDGNIYSFAWFAISEAR